MLRKVMWESWNWGYRNEPAMQEVQVDRALVGPSARTASVRPNPSGRRAVVNGVTCEVCCVRPRLQRNCAILPGRQRLGSPV